MANFSIFRGSSSFQKKSSSGKKQERLPIYNASWECTSRVTLEGCNSDIKSYLRSVLIVNNNMVNNIKWFVLNTRVVNLNAIWGKILS